LYRIAADKKKEMIGEREQSVNNLRDTWQCKRLKYWNQTKEG
jgi:hypothetical protein